MADVTIIGGANADIGGFPETAAVAEDSNPGKVRISAGGVGRNIAANAALMGLNTALVAAFGGDYNGEWLRKDCERNGIDLSEAFVFPEENTSTYLYIADETGDMRLAINDMAITQRLTPEALQPKIEKLNRSSAVVLDANLPPRTIEWLSEQLTVPIIADAVSAAKVERLVPILDRLDAFKPNRIEAEMLTGITINDETGARLAAEELVARGVRRVFLTLGDKGVCIADKDCNRFVKPVPVNLINATGAGDAFTAALVWATLRGCDLTETVAAGMAASSVAVESTLTVSPNMSAELLIERMNKILEDIR